MPAQLHQVAAMAFVYRRLVIVTCALPLMMLFSPFVFFVVLGLLRQCTDFGLLTTALTIILTLAARDQIHRLSNSKEALEASLRKNQVVLPLFMFVLSCVASGVLGPALDKMGLATMIRTPGSIRIWTAVRLSVAVLLLGMLVAARFVGPTSIMRLSVVPLVSNPWDVTLSHARQQPWSLLLELSGGGGGASKDSSSRKMGRRFQRPTFHAILQHIFLSLLSGAIVTYAVVLPLFGTITELFARSAILTTCLLTTLATLTSVLDGVSHEIDPSQYLYPSSKSVRKLRNKVAYLALAVSLLSIALVVATAGEAPIIYIGRLYMNLPIISGIMATYMYIIDETIRTALFNPRADIHQIVDELHDDTSENTRLLVILLSLLCDLSLVKEVRRPSHQGGIGGPERDELKLSEKLTNVMANIFLLQLDQQTEAPLEEDAFRISILESLGGPSLLENTSDGIERHQKIINAWIDQPSPRSRKLQEPLSTPLVRGLCVFIGGFGKALEICATTSCGETWKIPPAAFVCMNFAVQATARCLVRSLTPSGRTLCDWKSSHLSIQVPAALQALFQLRNGIVRHSKIVNNGETNSLTLVSNTTGGHLTGECGVIVRACDTAATSILQSLRSLKGLGRIELSLDLDCLEWTNTLLKRHTTTQ